MSQQSQHTDPVIDHQSHADDSPPQRKVLKLRSPDHVLARIPVQQRVAVLEALVQLDRGQSFSPSEIHAVLAEVFP